MSRQKKPDKVRVTLIVAFWQRFQELVSPTWRVSATKKKARCFSSCAKVNKFSRARFALRLRFVEWQRKHFETKVARKRTVRRQRIWFWLACLTRKLRESERRAKDEDKHNKSLDVRAKQRLCYHVVFLIRSCVLAVSPHVNSIVRCPFWISRLLPPQLAHYRKQAKAFQKFGLKLNR